MEIRSMTIADYPDVYELWMSSAGMGLNDLDDSEEGIGRFLDRNPTTCFVATEGNKVVGVIIAGHDGRRGYVYHTAVAEQYKRQGIGRRLVESSLKALSEEGINKVALLVFNRNEVAKRFWKKMGFEARTPEEGDDIVYYNKALADIKRIDT
jgi:acetyltransferase, GNAT family